MDTFDPGTVERQSLWEPIAAALRRAIILGELPAGLHLEEPVLSEKFGVSRIPIREAVIRLAYEGLVRMEPRRGAFVDGMTAADIHDIFEFRILLERYAIRRAAACIDAVGLARLVATVEQMEEAVYQNNPQLVAEPDLHFHRQIVALSGNKRAMTAWEPIGDLVAVILSITDTTTHDLPGSVRSHWWILQGLEQRDPDLAESHLVPHIQGAENLLQEAIRRVQTKGRIASLKTTV